MTMEKQLVGGVRAAVVAPAGMAAAVSRCVEELQPCRPCWRYSGRRCHHGGSWRPATAGRPTRYMTRNKVVKSPIRKIGANPAGIVQR